MSDETKLMQPMRSTSFMEIYLEHVLENEKEEKKQDLTEERSTKDQQKPALSRLEQLPPDVWRNILINLPLSQYPEMDRLSKHIQTIARYSSLYWIHVADRGPPSLNSKSKTFYGQLNQVRKNYTKVFRQACDYCYGNHKYKPHKVGWMAVLPVRIPNYARREMYLCGPCRQAHYEKHPETIPIDVKKSKATPAMLQDKYPFTKNQRKQLGINGMTELEILLCARKFYGGNVGIQAERLRRQYNGSLPAKQAK
ncbi:uncharacterized protein BX664DRAFT_327980 [Halteromyces radiatus]|uniref:uncharacterized protein n=1 Tax=Halteromyces radiatus TaxID=101107 RepID=UPI00221FD692|nr:uncharacterized protein BX664DRAFT_327980 [Halteromyces radiatus]KAI8092724.1 hypothetical protein BX664DRAFT_327980 [Halteromyces radiatus]